MSKRGRPKGSKKSSHEEPHNYFYWRGILENPNYVNDFIERGNKEQHSLMKQTLEYLQRGNKSIVIHNANEQYVVEDDLNYFRKINGKIILKQLKEKGKSNE